MEQAPSWSIVKSQQDWFYGKLIHNKSGKFSFEQLIIKQHKSVLISTLTADIFLSFCNCQVILNSLISSIYFICHVKYMSMYALHNVFKILT